MTTVWNTDRTYSWLLELTDLAGRLVRTIDTSPAFAWVWDLDLDVRGAGVFDVVTTGQSSIPLPSDVDWERHRLRLSHVLYPADGSSPVVTRVALATPADPGETGPRMLTTKLMAADATMNLNMETDGTLEFGAGASVTGVIEALYGYALVLRYAITPHSGVLPRTLSYPPKTKVSTIINEVARTIGYAASWADADGVVRCEPYVRPSARGTSAVLTPGVNAMYADTWTLKTSPRPNRLVVSSAVPADAPAGTEARRTIQSDYVDASTRGRWITQTWDNVDAADAATFFKLAAAKWEEVRSPNVYLTIRHAFDPALLGNVNFEFEDQLWTVTRQEMKSADRLVTTTARGVPRDTRYLETTTSSTQPPTVVT